jgi:hypothetical protein
MDRSKKSNKNNKKFEDLKNLPCPFHKNAKHMVAECRQLQELGFYAKSIKGKSKADTTRMETTTLIQASSSLKVPLQ